MRAYCFCRVYDRFDIFAGAGDEQIYASTIISETVPLYIDIKKSYSHI